ncbi:hypothetical protein [Photobacterium iliopiscarium]|uniref:hypothetical protein n=1 Tax=Photobacterium iliopiscarium TaxID=56192 RepID=UPI0005D3A948|nr:hypothetical protein [Photobacterium iliopiscarium]KJG11965.1 hypothetical protein UB38_18280 [Photobacterium iliopiscarium]PST96825.1 hypothetical protein C9I85_18885 [Photobacterium iliopiscarium]PSV79027.1 hypothetical protein C9J51_19130 [Photobacterium iliopiscarium]
MDLFTFLPTLLSVLGGVISGFAMYQSSRSLRRRLRIERKLAHNLALELQMRKIESQVTFELNKLEVRGKICDTQDFDKIKLEIDDAIRCAVKRLVEEEQMVIKKSLEQPSKQGQGSYIRKILNNSLQELSHQKA